MTTTSMHLATTKDGLGTRLVVAFKQIPENPLNALVINIDKIIKTVDRDELLYMVHSQEGSHERDFINVLHRKGLLPYYHSNGFFQVMSIDEVLMTPDNKTTIPLRTVINEINKMNGIGNLPTPEEMINLSKANPTTSAKRAEMMQTESKAGIARSKLIQAKLMWDEVIKMFSEVVSLDPTLAQTVNEIRNNGLIKPIQLELHKPAIVETKPAVKTSKRATAAKTKRAVKK